MNFFRSRTLRLLSVAALFVPSACNTMPDEPIHEKTDTQGFSDRAAESPEEEPWLAIGDSFEIFDAHNPELRLESTVGVDGTVHLPELGAVLVAGQTGSELEALLVELYSPHFERLDIEVRILAAGKKYFVFGQVSSQGAQPFAGDVTILEAVTKAKPLPGTANLGRVRLIRADPSDPTIQTLDLTVDLQRVIEIGDSTHNVHVQAGDVIHVPAAEPKR